MSASRKGKVAPTNGACSNSGSAGGSTLPKTRLFGHVTFRFLSTNTRAFVDTYSAPA